MFDAHLLPCGDLNIQLDQDRVMVAEPTHLIRIDDLAVGELRFEFFTDEEVIILPGLVTAPVSVRLHKVIEKTIETIGSGHCSGQKAEIKGKRARRSVVGAAEEE